MRGVDDELPPALVRLIGARVLHLGLGLGLGKVKPALLDAEHDLRKASPQPTHAVEQRDRPDREDNPNRTYRQEVEDHCGTDVAIDGHVRPHDSLQLVRKLRIQRVEDDVDHRI